MKHIKKNRIFISILLVTLFYIIFTIFSDIEEIKNDYQNFNLFYFLPVLPILFISMFFRSLIQKYLLKKLGIEICSNESSIYRYFESKHALLVYLVNWYWSWIEYKLVFSTNNINSPKEKLKKAIHLLTEEIKEDNSITFINEIRLNKIIISESAKAYHTKEVDKENQKGYYKTYKRLVQRVSDFILAINPKYAYPHMLVSTIIEGAHHQRYFTKHLPSLTDTKKGRDAVVNFYNELIKKAIE